MAEYNLRLSSACVASKATIVVSTLPDANIKQLLGDVLCLVDCKRASRKHGYNCRRQLDARDTAYMKRWRAANPGYSAVKSRERRQHNHQRKLDYNRDWHRRNPGAESGYPTNLSSLTKDQSRFIDLSFHCS